MVGRRPWERGEVEKREGRVEGRVSEDMIQASKNGVWLLVGPGIKPIREINLTYIKVLNRVIESSAKGIADLPIVLVSCAPDKVEVTKEDPWPRDQWQ